MSNDDGSKGTGDGGGKRILLGRIKGAHGIRGEVVIASFAERPEDIGSYGALTDGRGGRRFLLTSVRATAKGVVARIENVRDRTAAEALRGIELWVDRERLPAAPEGEFYHADLIGLAAVAPDGTPIGTVVAVENFGAGDLLEIRLTGSRRSELVPFSDPFVPDVDVPGGRLVVVMPVDAPESEEPPRGDDGAERKHRG